jgi:hypothetical protein
MSHNKFTVAGQSPNASSEISVSLNNLSDVSISSPSLNEILQYTGTGFTNSAFSGSLEMSGVFTVFQKTNTSYSSSGYYDVNDYLFLSRDTQTSRNKVFVDASFVSSNEATATNSVKSNYRFLESINILQAGTYLCICSVPLRSTNGGYAVRWHSNAGGFGAKSDIYYTNRTGGLVVGIITAPANDVLRVVVETENGSAQVTGSNHNKSYSIHIFKI